MDGTWECLRFVWSNLANTSWYSIQHNIYYIYSINIYIYDHICTYPHQLITVFKFKHISTIPIVARLSLSDHTAAHSILLDLFVLQIPKPVGVRMIQARDEQCPYLPKVLVEYELQAVHVQAWKCNDASTKIYIHLYSNPSQIGHDETCVCIGGPFFQVLANLPTLRSDIFAFAREAAKNVSQSGVVGVAWKMSYPS